MARAALWLLLFALFAAPSARAECQPIGIHVHGSSLEPLVADGAAILGTRGLCPGHPKRGELVLFLSGNRPDPLIKIAVGLPGDRFALASNDRGEWSLLINGAVAKTSTGATYSFDAHHSGMLVLCIRDRHGVIPPNAYLLLGNHIDGTIDSTLLGLIGANDIIGTAPRPAPPARRVLPPKPLFRG
jgi:signal peptidase I